MHLDGLCQEEERIITKETGQHIEAGSRSEKYGCLYDTYIQTYIHASNVSDCWSIIMS